MTDAIQAAAWRIAVLADGGLDGTVALKDAAMIANAYLGMLAFRAGKDPAGENAGLTQASDSLARISNYVNESSVVGERIEKVGRALLSSHPEDGGIREALEDAARKIEARSELYTSEEEMCAALIEHCRGAIASKPSHTRVALVAYHSAVEVLLTLPDGITRDAAITKLADAHIAARAALNPAPLPIGEERGEKN